MMETVRVADIAIGAGRPLVLIAGPCVIEDAGMALRIAREVKGIADEVGMPYVFKASYDKANRSSGGGFRGPGLKEGLTILEAVREEIGVPVLSDVHAVEEVGPTSDVLDVLQIPAFLCRQTDLVTAAGETGKPVNVKKGQFLAPWDMQNVVDKIAGTGNRSILLTERGTCFGYNNLVVDMRSLIVMRRIGFPVVFDATHSVQLPGGAGSSSGGQSEFAPYLARAAAAVGMDALFLEVHTDPGRALCDGPNMIRVDALPGLLRTVKEIHEIPKR